MRIGTIMMMMMMVKEMRLFVEDEEDDVDHEMAEPPAKDSI